MIRLGYFDLPARGLLDRVDMRSQRAFLPLDWSEDSIERDSAPDLAGAPGPGPGRMTSAAEYGETYLDWPPRRRKPGRDRGDRQPGAIRRLRRFSR